MNLQNKHPKIIGMWLALIWALFMSFDGIFIKLSGVGWFDTAFLFGLFTAISMAFFIQIFDKRGLVKTIRSGWYPIIFSGLLMLGSASSLVFSFLNTSVANTLIILSIAPALAAIFSHIFLWEKTKLITWIAIISVIVWIFIVVSGSFESGNILWDIYAIIAVICLSFNQVLMRKYHEVSRMWSIWMGWFFLATVMFFFAEPSNFSLNTWLIMWAMWLITAPFWRVSAMSSLRYITASELWIILMLETVIAPILAYFAFTEIPSIQTLIGWAIILITITVYILVSAKKK